MLRNGRPFVRFALHDESDAELGRPAGRGLRRASAEQADLEACALRPDDGRAVPDVERLDFAGRRSEQHDRAVGQHAIDVEQEQPDAAGACVTVPGGNGMGSGSSGNHDQSSASARGRAGGPRPATWRSASTTTSDVILRSSMRRRASTASMSPSDRDRAPRHDGRPPCLPAGWTGRHVASQVAVGHDARQAMVRVDHARHAQALARHLVDDVRHGRRRADDRDRVARLHQRARPASAACRAGRPGAGRRSPPAGSPCAWPGPWPAHRRARARRSCWPWAPGSSGRPPRRRGSSA